VYLDPANFKNIGDGHTIADQINEVLEPYDLGVIAASNDRIGGWQLRSWQRCGPSSHILRSQIKSGKTENSD